MTAKPKIFRYFPERWRDAIVLHVALDAVEDAALIGGKVEIVHTYKCTYFVDPMQYPVFSLR
jgi:hypothetical protein